MIQFEQCSRLANKRDSYGERREASGKNKLFAPNTKHTEEFESTCRAEFCIFLRV